jgi:hypothetical protein
MAQIDFLLPAGTSQNLTNELLGPKTFSVDRL